MSTTHLRFSVGKSVAVLYLMKLSCFGGFELKHSCEAVSVGIRVSRLDDSAIVTGSKVREKAGWGTYIEI